jgi:hypothetical protein
MDSFENAPCYMDHQSFDNVLFNFPEDDKPSDVANFYEGESNKFFQEFNSQSGSMEHARYMKELTLYQTKFDLRMLKAYTSDLTEKVIIKADTVHITSPIMITHKLEIHARVVSIQHAITMNMTMEQFFTTEDIEFWAKKEEVYTVGKVMMNRKSYGLVTILRNAAEIPLPSDSACQPKYISVEESGFDISDWYDVTSVNLNYVCARTVMDTRMNAPLVDDISNFMLGFVYNDTIINNRATFLAVQKFKRLQQLNAQNGVVHNVPTYSVATISSLASVMHTKMHDYRENEMQQELNLTLASGRSQDMQVHFKEIEQQQQLYFELEKAQLDAIWAAADNNWNFDFEHRNGIEDSISGSLDSMSDEMFAMQETDLKNALAAAKLSQAHIDAVVEEYETQVARTLDLVKGSITIQKNLVDRLKQNAHDMDIEFKKFEIAIEVWKHKQEVKAAWAVFKAVLSFGVGLATGSIDPEEIADVIENIIEIEELLIELIQVIEDCNAIQDMIDEIDFSGIADITLNLNTNFKDALQSAIDLKLKGPDFDVVERTATIKLDAMNQATDFGIEGTDTVMMACTSVADVGHSLINEASQFAENVMALAERNDELAVARQDRNNTLEEIHRIEQLLVDLQAEREEFEANRDQAKQEYEQWLEDMKADYEHMTAELREEYRQKITESFEKFKTVFKGLSDSYNNQIYQLMASIHRKFYGLKEHSMNQRAMIMALFVDYCDADYYHTFRSCDKKNLPYMSDDLDTILAKLIDIKWETVTASENIPGTPIDFDGEFLIENDGGLIGGKKQYVIENLRDRHETEINLRELDFYNRFDDFWRVRIERIFLVLRNDQGNLIQSNGTTFGKEIQIQIRYPTIFNDSDSTGGKRSFLALNFACNSDYTTTDQVIDWTSSCVVNEEFSYKNYKPAPDGVFTFKIMNPETFALNELAQVSIGFSGSRIIKGNGKKSNPFWNAIASRRGRRQIRRLPGY